VAGTLAHGLLLDRLTTVSEGARPLRVTRFNVVETPPSTDIGDKETETRFKGLTVRFAVRLAPLYVAESVAIVAAETAVVLTGNVALNAPAGTDIVAGTVAAVLLLDRATTIPPAGA